MSTSGAFRELNSVVRTDTLTFLCKEFRLIRLILRLLSLWRPRSAGILESYVYPIFVNLVFLAAELVRNTIRATNRPSILSIQSIYVIHELGIWLGHILGNIYFRSRDLETNVLPEALPLTKIRKPLKRRLKYLNYAMILSLVLFSIMLCTLFVVLQFRWNRGKKRFSSDLPNVHGTVDHILYILIIISIVYNLGIALALSWTMGLLYVCFASRLKALEEIYLTWKKPKTDAVYFFQQFYSRPVKRSWKRISWWFLVHNVIVLAVPLYGYELAQAVSGEAYQSKHLPQFICYMLFVLTVWLMPILMAEQFKRSEKKFHERVNNFCPGTLREITVKHPFDSSISLAVRDVEEALDSSRANEEEDIQTYTFASRGKELKDLLRFLKKRRLGLVSRAYTLQLNLSLVSVIIGIVSFLLKLYGDDEIQFINTSTKLNSTFL